MGSNLVPISMLIERQLALYAMAFSVEALDAALAHVRAG